MSLNLCQRETPILLNNGSCLSIYCSNEQILSEECIIDNDIIKIQWLNNFIPIGKDYSTFANFAEYSNGDLIILIEDDTGSNFRYFFGIKTNGRPFFNDSNEETFYYSITTQIYSNNQGHDRQVCMAKINTNQEEYIINIQKERNNYVELFDFKNDKTYKKITSELLGNPLYNYRGSCFNIKQENNEYYFLLASLMYVSRPKTHRENIFYLILQKLKFNTKESIENDSDCLIKNSTELEGYSDIISCFETNSKIIVCFYLYYEKGTGDKYYGIASFDENLTEKNITDKIPATYDVYQIFYKCLHYAGETGIFVYYKLIEENVYPTFFFKTITSSEFIDSFPEIPEITIESYILESLTILNDFIKLKEKNFILVSVNEKKDTLFIISLFIFQNNGNKIKIRIYKINLLKLYNYEIYKTIRLHSYNNKFLALSLSICYTGNCFSDQLHYSFALFFSYPNSTDINLTINDELIKYNFLTLNFEKNITIENNIFGYIFSGILIKNFEGCENINFVSSSKGAIIKIIYTLEKNENIIANLNFNDYDKFNCKIEYSYEVTEPDYEEFEKFPSIINTTYGDDEEIFEQLKQKYVGRTSYYNLFLSEKLTYDCIDNNCGLCLLDKTTCIVCKYNFTIEKKQNEDIEKICFNNTEEEISKEEELESTKVEIESSRTEEEESGEEIDISNGDIEMPREEELTNKIEFSEEEKLKNENEFSKEEKNEIESSLYKEEEKEKEISKEEENIKLEDSTSIEKNISEEEISNIEYTSSIEKEISKIVTSTSLEKYISTEKEISENEKEFLKEITDSIKEEENSKIEETDTKENEKEIKKEIEKLTEKITDIKTCNKSEILNNTCQDGSLTNEQFNELYEEIEKKYINNETYHGENTIILTGNVVFQIAKLDEQKENTSNNISSIDLGECETKLKQYYSINKDESLIIYKQDIRKENLATTFVLYKIYHPYTLLPLNLSICSEDQISLSVPVNLQKDTLSLYTSLNESGYNLFDANDSFYNDICTPYTSNNGTDIILSDRKEIIVDIGNDMNLCQSGCNLMSFNSANNKATCICYVENTKSETNFNKLNTENFIEDLIHTLKYSNYLVLKCYKLLYNFKALKNNIGFIIMDIVFISFVILVLIFIIKGVKKIEYLIYSVLKYKENFNKNKLNKGNKRKNDENLKINKNLNKINHSFHKKSKDDKINDEISKKKNKIKKSKEIKNIKNTKNEYDKKSKSKKENKKKNNPKNKNQEPPIKKAKKIKEFNFIPIKRENKKNKTTKNKTISQRELISIDNNNKINNLNINIVPIGNLHYKNINKEIPQKFSKSKSGNINLFNPNEIKGKKVKLKLKEEKANNNNNQNITISNGLIERELDELNYSQAIKLDKRTFFQYYGSLLRRKQLIIFTFMSYNDYNLITFKIILFLINFSLYMVVDAFFFSSKQMHEIYVRNGSYDIFLQIPQILYSTLITAAVNIILKQLSLSDNTILKIKREKNIKIAYSKAKNIKSYIKIKFLIFISLCLIFIIFFLYYISCFCAVYTNTQYILIKDTFISFSLSMIYPFGLYLLPGIFRITALRDKKHDKERLYIFSRIISFL